MILSELLNLVQQTAERIGTSEPFICGGTPRDKVLGLESEIKDIDITTGDATIHHLAKELSIKLKGPDTFFKTMADGHSQLITNGVKLDFSSNFIVGGLGYLLRKAGLKRYNDMQLELYSRDFTCNALLMTMDLKSIKDPIGLGMKDIKDKLLKTCLPASITLGSDNKRIPRVLYMAAKLGFKVDEEIMNWIKKNPQAISTLDSAYVANKITKALEYDSEGTVRLLDELGLWKHLPPIEGINKYIVGDLGRV